MPDSHAMEIPGIPRGAALVSVDGRALSRSRRHASWPTPRGGGLSTLSRVPQPVRRALEVVYTLPLPADGAVIGYAIRMGQRVNRGEVARPRRCRRRRTKRRFEGRAAGLNRIATTRSRSVWAALARQAREITIEVLHPWGSLGRR